MCYTYDSLNRVIKRQVVSLDCDCVVSEENYNYDAAGNIICSPDSCFQYDTNNRLTVFNGQTVEYDMDGNMVSDGCTAFEYDSANRLVKAGGHTYTYNAEDVRIRNLCSDADTNYTYNTNCKLSQLLTKTTNGITTKYVYGLGLIGEEKESCFKTYHFDYRGSTVAITDINGNITDTFKYDTYGRVIEHIGNTFVIFGYNGRDGVITDKNGLYYMRARYYSPDLRRFMNADIVRGEIADSTSLNRYSYVNGNPVSFVDPTGLSKERGSKLDFTPSMHDLFFEPLSAFAEDAELLRSKIYNYKYNSIKQAPKPIRRHKGSWVLETSRKLSHLDDAIGPNSNLAKNIPKFNKTIDFVGNVATAYSVGSYVSNGVKSNLQSGTRVQKVVSDAAVDFVSQMAIVDCTTLVGGYVGSLIPIPVVGTLVGAAAGYIVGEFAEWFINTEFDMFGGQSIVGWAKDGAALVADSVVYVGEWVADTVSDIWDSTADFLDNAGDAVSGFLDDVGGFVCGLFT